MRHGAIFFLDHLTANAPRVAVENPIMHGYAQRLIRPPDFSVQPFEHGHPESKRTCFWTIGLDPLTPTNVVPSEGDGWHMGLGPHPDRAKIRSRTFQGIADAMADQWGGGGHQPDLLRMVVDSAPWHASEDPGPVSKPEA